MVQPATGTISGAAREFVVMTMEVVQDAHKTSQSCVRHDGVLIKQIIAAIQPLISVINTKEWDREYVVSLPPTFL